MLSLCQNKEFYFLFRTGKKGKEIMMMKTQREIILQRVPNHMISEGSLILINSTTPLLKECKEEDLVVVNVRDKHIKMTVEAAKHLNALMNEINGWSQIVGTSGWRSKRSQEMIWEEFSEKYGEAYTRKYVAVPGQSDYHLIILV